MAFFHVRPTAPDIYQKLVNSNLGKIKEQLAGIRILLLRDASPEELLESATLFERYLSSLFKRPPEPTLGDLHKLYSAIQVKMSEELKSHPIPPAHIQKLKVTIEEMATDFDRHKREGTRLLANVYGLFNPGGEKLSQNKYQNIVDTNFIAINAHLIAIRNFIARGGSTDELLKKSKEFELFLKSLLKPPSEPTPQNMQKLYNAIKVNAAKIPREEKLVPELSAEKFFNKWKIIIGEMKADADPINNPDAQLLIKVYGLLNLGFEGITYLSEMKLVEDSLKKKPAAITAVAPEEKNDNPELIEIIKKGFPGSTHPILNAEGVLLPNIRQDDFTFVNAAGIKIENEVGKPIQTPLEADCIAKINSFSQGLLITFFEPMKKIISESAEKADLAISPPPPTPDIKIEIPSANIQLEIPIIYDVYQDSEVIARLSVTLKVTAEPKIESKDAAGNNLYRYQINAPIITSAGFAADILKGVINADTPFLTILKKANSESCLKVNKGTLSGKVQKVIDELKTKGEGLLGNRDAKRKAKQLEDALTAANLQFKPTIVDTNAFLNVGTPSIKAILDKDYNNFVKEMLKDLVPEAAPIVSATPRVR